MDSLTQILLGAATCGIVARKPLRRTMLYGAAMGTLPDLDVFLLGHFDPVEQFVRHRGFSHSLFVLTAAAPALAWLLRRIDPALRTIAPRRWALAVWLALVTHALLDAFTVYGTQLLWPLMPPPTAWSSVFIIDPLYTLPLLAAIVVAWRRGNAASASKALAVGLLLAQAYLAWGVIARLHVERQVGQILADRGQPAQALLVSPAPFTTLLWRVLVRTPEGHAEGWYSLLRSDPEQFRPRPIGHGAELRAGLPPLAALETLTWFSHGFLQHTEVDGRLRVADLRMGADPDFFFVFDIALRDGDAWRAIPPERVAMERPRAARLSELLDRF